MRDRLIELFKQADEKAGEYIRENDHMDFIPTKDELAGVYADHFLANGVIVPPVFVGQMVYHYCPDLGGVFPYFVETVNVGYLGKERNYWTYEANCHDEETDEFLDGIDFDLDDIGKTVFLTREEAEKALKEAKG